jgi:hypothetical protein
MLERRRHPRFAVRLPFLLKSITGKVQGETRILLAKNVSKSGLCFASKRRIEPGLSIEAEVILLGYGPSGSDVHIMGAGRIVRAEERDESGWYELAATFDELPSGGAQGWNQLAAAFDDPRSSAKGS